MALLINMPAFMSFKYLYNQKVCSADTLDAQCCSNQLKHTLYMLAICTYFEVMLKHEMPLF